MLRKLVPGTECPFYGLAENVTRRDFRVAASRSARLPTLLLSHRVGSLAEL